MKARLSLAVVFVVLVGAGVAPVLGRHARERAVARDAGVEMRRGGPAAGAGRERAVARDAGVEMRRADPAAVPARARVGRPRPAARAVVAAPNESAVMTALTAS